MLPRFGLNRLDFIRLGFYRSSRRLTVIDMALLQAHTPTIFINHIDHFLVIFFLSDAGDRDARFLQIA